ncbi:MAG: glycosyltransferase family 4 protein [Oscillospiraceae bacterium]
MDEKKQNVLVVHNYYQLPGGEDTVAQNEISMLKEHGHKVIFYTRSNSEIKNMDLIRKVGLAFSSIFSFRTYRDVRKMIREESIDVVHVHNTLSMISQSVYYAALSMNVPVVQTVHNFRMLCPAATFYRDGHICEDCVEKGQMCAVKHKCYRGSRSQTLVCVINTLFHRMTGIYGKINYICLTEFNKTKLLQLRQISAEQVSVKPNCINCTGTIICEDDRSDQYIYAGRLEKIKGIDVLLDAWALLGKNTPKLILCGAGPMEDWCRKYIAEHSLNAELRGQLQNNEVRSLLAESKALILPTRWYEGFPMSIAEAFSVGTPVICSDIGNAASIVDEGVTGCKFSPGNAQELAEAVKRCKDLCNSTFDVFQKKYTAENNYKQLFEIYRCACKLSKTKKRKIAR